MAIGEANGKSSTFTIKYNNRLPRQIVWVPCGFTDRKIYRVVLFKYWSNSLVLWRAALSELSLSLYVMGV